MAKPITGLMRSEAAVVEELRLRLSSAGRAPTFVLAGAVEAGRLCLVLQTFIDSVSGRFINLGTKEALEDLENGPPLHGREVGQRLSDTVVRQFLLRKANELTAPVLAVHAPPVLWKIITETEADGPRRLLAGLREWASPRTLVLSYPIGADPSSLTIEELADLLSDHLVELKLTDPERRYLESDWEGDHP